VGAEKSVCMTIVLETHLLALLARPSPLLPAQSQGNHQLSYPFHTPSFSSLPVRETRVVLWGNRREGGKEEVAAADSSRQ